MYQSIGVWLCWGPSSVVGCRCPLCSSTISRLLANLVRRASPSRIRLLSPTKTREPLVKQGSKMSCGDERNTRTVWLWPCVLYEFLLLYQRVKVKSRNSLATIQLATMKKGLPQLRKCSGKRNGPFSPWCTFVELTNNHRQSIVSYFCCCSYCCHYNSLVHVQSRVWRVSCEYLASY